MILDFYCPEIRLGIELDGIQHLEDSAVLHDTLRDEYLMEEFNISILRFSNWQIRTDMVSVITAIKNKAEHLLLNKYD
jgi:very-short-patch-repair endonuclease